MMHGEHAPVSGRTLVSKRPRESDQNRAEKSCVQAIFFVRKPSIFRSTPVEPENNLIQREIKEGQNSKSSVNTYEKEIRFSLRLL
jgi:hypothetical protein